MEAVSAMVLVFSHGWKREAGALNSRFPTLSGGCVGAQRHETAGGVTPSSRVLFLVSSLKRLIRNGTPDQARLFAHRSIRAPVGVLTFTYRNIFKVYLISSPLNKIVRLL